MSPRDLRRQDGMLLPTAMLLLMICMAVGLVAVRFVDSQQSQAGYERTREASFQLAEAALNGQVFQLARAWAAKPASVGAPALYPTQCTSADAASLTSPCPDQGSIAESYKVRADSVGTNDYGARTCNGVASVPWTTTVRDNGVTAGGADARVYYDATAMPSMPAYDDNQDGQVWVRSTGVASCRVQTVVARVSQRFVTLPFPREVVGANWLKVTNTASRKTFIDSKFAAPEAAAVTLRCAGLTDLQCSNTDPTKPQVSPSVPTKRPSPALPDPYSTVTAAVLDSFRRQAAAAGTYYPKPGGPTCPSSLTGAIVFIEDTTSCTSFSGGNSSAAPGFLVIGKGPLNFGGASIFYGIIYSVNATNIAYPTPVVKFGGNSRIEGAIAIDNRGGIEVGSSSRPHVAYDPRAFPLVKTHAGAAIVRNSWRLLPRGQ